MSSSIFAFGRTIVALGFIIGMILVLARFARKHQAGASGPATVSSTRIDVLSRRSLGQRVNLVVVRVAGRTFLVGQSAQQMSMLAELVAEEGVEEHTSGASTTPNTNQLLAPRMVSGAGDDSPWALDAFIDRLREKTVRR